MIVVWTDAAANLGDEAGIDQPADLDRFGGMATCRDIGWLISKNRKEVRLCVGQVLDDETIRHSNTIPTGWIKEIIYLNNPFEEPHAVSKPIAN